MIKKGEHINKQDIIDFSSSVFPRTKDPTNQLIINTNSREELLLQIYNEDFGWFLLSLFILHCFITLMMK